MLLKNSTSPGGSLEFLSIPDHSKTLYITHPRLGWNQVLCSSFSCLTLVSPVVILFPSGPLKEDCHWHKQICPWLHQMLYFSLSSSEPDTSGFTLQLETLCPGLQIIALPPSQMPSSSILKCVSGLGLCPYTFNSLLHNEILWKPYSARVWSLYGCQTEWGNRTEVCQQTEQGSHPWRTHFASLPRFVSRIRIPGGVAQKRWVSRICNLKMGKEGNLYGKAKWK